MLAKTGKMSVIVAFSGFLTLLGGNAFAGGARGGGVGLFVLGEEITGSGSAFRSFGRPMASQSVLLFDFEGTISGRKNLIGLSFYVGSQLQNRIGRLHAGFGPGILAGGWLFTPDDDCEFNDECIAGVAGNLGFAVAGETGFTLSQRDARRMDLIIRGLWSLGNVTRTNDIQIWQIYVGIRISK